MRRFFTIFAVLSLMAVSSRAQSLLKGDANGDGEVDISDVVFVVNKIISGHAYGALWDVNSDYTVDISDVVWLVNTILESNDDKPTPGEAIDLGLSVKWASHNVGTPSPEGYGGYYAWGETEERGEDTYTDENYAYYVNNGYELWYYANLGSSICGTKYDVANVKWGGSWRMPTLDEISELMDKCTWKWTTYHGVNGEMITGPNGNKIFLPAAGNCFGTGCARRGISGDYWSGTAYPDSDNRNLQAGFFSFGEGGYGYYECQGRACGFSIRPVTP